jgi:peptidoglycan lytic transglycosylase
VTLSRHTTLVVVIVGLAALGAPTVRAQSGQLGTSQVLSATAHASIPTSLDEVWLAPSGRPSTALTSFGKAVALIAETKYEQAAVILQKAPLASTPLTGYGKYYAALVAFRQNRLDDARQAATALVDANPGGALGETSRRLAGEIAEAQNDSKAAIDFYEPLTKTVALAPDEAWNRLARARQASGDTKGAAEAYAHVYYEFPLGDLATTAASQIAALNAWGPIESGSSRYKLELGRAERLFGAKRYAQARDGFALVQSSASGDDKELIALRLAESDYYLRRYQSAQEQLGPWTGTARRRAEAQFFYMGAVRELGDDAEYIRLANALVSAFPGDAWAEETLNNLASYYIIKDQDDSADQAFRQLAQMFPQGRYVQRALWKIGWTSYRTGKWAECADIFERAAAAFPRSDYRPTWVYWAARSREQLGDGSAADRLYGVIVADYLNSYYGRLATKRLTARKVEPMTLAASVKSGGNDAVPAIAGRTAASIPSADVIRSLLAAGLYDDALNEIQWAQKTGGDSPVLQATIGYTWAQKGDLRRGINGIKRAFPQYLSASGQELPAEVLQVLFPVAYWDLIEKNCSTNSLDPYLVAALIAQESTFDAEIVSHAKAIGLMQIVAKTGRSYARRLHIPRYSTSRLTDPQVNMRIGSAYFADLIDRFGGVSYALASYNAGEGAVARWIAERPGIAVDEFVDDIPYPETQNYVRKILGTAEDYRRLYGERGVRPSSGPPATVQPTAPHELLAIPQSSSPVKTTPPAPAKKKPAHKGKKRHH